MGFSRVTEPAPIPEAEDLTSHMAGIGMNFAAQPHWNANIEDTLFRASELGMLSHDFRVLSVLTTWLGVHHARINADRLVRVVSGDNRERLRAYWAAIAQWLDKDRRFQRLRSLYDRPYVDLLPTGTDFQLERRGVDPRFEGSPLRVPEGTLRDRPSDVATPELLVKHHRGYRNRVLMGSGWRADVWTVLEDAPDISVAEAARRSYASFATAWQVSQDFQLYRIAE